MHGVFENVVPVLRGSMRGTERDIFFLHPLAIRVYSVHLVQGRWMSADKLPVTNFFLQQYHIFSKIDTQMPDVSLKNILF